MSSAPRPAPHIHSLRAPRLASFSTSTGCPSASDIASAARTPTHPGRIVESPSSPVGRCTGPGRPMPTPAISSLGAPASSSTSPTRRLASAIASAAGRSVSSRSWRSASTTCARSATATRRWLLPKSSPSATPAERCSATSTGGRPIAPGSRGCRVGHGLDHEPLRLQIGDDRRHRRRGQRRPTSEIGARGRPARGEHPEDAGARAQPCLVGSRHVCILTFPTATYQQCLVHPPIAV